MSSFARPKKNVFLPGPFLCGGNCFAIWLTRNPSRTESSGFRKSGVEGFAKNHCET